MTRRGDGRRRWERALVTGASRGIGRAFAAELARRGTDVVVVGRAESLLRTLAAELSPAVRVEVIVADLSDPAAVARVEERLRDEERPVDLLVNNAGLATTGPFASLPAAGEEEQVWVNTLATVRLTHAALARMTGEGRGGVCNVSSLAYSAPLPGNATYGATKAFIASFTLALHHELRGSGVSVCALCPGFTETEAHAAAGFDTSWVPGFLWMTPEQVARAGLRDLERGRALSVPGLPYRALHTAFDVAPQPLVRWAGRSYVAWGRATAGLRRVR